MERIEEFHNLHRGETCLIVAVGPNLDLTPPEKFNYPSFSCNSIFKREGWKPTYYVGVDERLKLEEGENIKTLLKDVKTFVPSPDWDDWNMNGRNVWRFKHREGPIYIGGQLPTQVKALSVTGIAYRRILGAVFQIAYFMGFKTMLCIGIQHKPGAEREHFWGYDEGVVAEQPLIHWFEEYRQWSNFGKAKVLNISEDTYVPENIIPRDDWMKWSNK